MRDITLIFGCMFSGKTTKLIEFYSYSEFENHEKLAVKPLLDSRYNAEAINSHGGLYLPSHRISKPEELYPLVTDNTKAIFVDEAQFFNDSISNVLLDLALNGIKVFVAGLDLDSQGLDFESMPALKKIANNHIQLFAKCQLCGQKAKFTFRNGDNSAQILIGHGDIYEPRCEEHWINKLLNNTNN